VDIETHWIRINHSGFTLVIRSDWPGYHLNVAVNIDGLKNAPIRCIFWLLMNSYHAGIAPAEPFMAPAHHRGACHQVLRPKFQGTFNE
jgi:hypothetical protein